MIPQLSTDDKPWIASLYPASVLRKSKVIVFAKSRQDAYLKAQAKGLKDNHPRFGVSVKDLRLITKDNAFASLRGWLVAREETGVKLLEAPAGEIAPNMQCVVFYDCFMHNAESWLELLIQVVSQYRSDDHLTG